MQPLGVVASRLRFWRMLATAAITSELICTGLFEMRDSDLKAAVYTLSVLALQISTAHFA